MFKLFLFILMAGFLFNFNYTGSRSYAKVTLKKDSLSEKVADAYGIKDWSNVEKIQFTFNVKTKNREVKRSWTWEPKTKKVTYKGKDENGKEISLSYSRANLNTSNKKIKFVDERFINDEYWLLFPFHLVWDSNLEIENAGLKDFPIGKGKGNLLIVKYKNDVGYTPNDIFELYLGKDNLIKQWVYRSGGKDNGSPATWENNKKFGNIIISTEHYGPGKKFKLWFSNLKVDFEK